jgi:DNA-binding CsgD family transcriptional regulator/tetratricopeptide (TPR) repeat protein
MRTRSPAMVDRTQELRAVNSTLHAARRGNGAALFVLGEAGIGKSRLAAAAADLGFAADMRMLRGRGSSIGPMVPFRSLTEALMSLLRSGDPIDPAQLGPYRPVLARLIPDWGAAAPAQDGGSLVVLAEAVLRLTDLAGRGRGCLLILDDLQDSDAESLAVVEYLADNIDLQATVLLCTVRTEPSPALDLARAAAQRGRAAVIELGRLNRAGVRALAASCLECAPPDVPDEVAEQLWADSGGIPLLAEELLDAMLRGGLLVRDGPEADPGADGNADADAGGPPAPGAAPWRVTGQLRTKLSATLTRSLTQRLDKVDPQGRRLLSAAAVLGRRFPLAVLQAATGVTSRELLAHLHTEPTAQFVAPDDETPDWYTFQHPLVVEALLSLLDPEERARLTARAADAVEQVFPGLPGEWCQACAALRLQAGDTHAAALLFAEAGRRALAQAGANSAVTLLDKALDLLGHGGDVQARADVFATLLMALAEAGLMERALASAGELDQFTGLLSHRSRARLHTRLAWAAAVAGRSAQGMAQVEVARRLLGADAEDRDTIPIDVVAAHLMLDLPGPDQVRAAEELARRAALSAESADLPEAACQAWQLLGALSRSRDPREATACLEQARELAVRHRLPVEEIHVLIRLGNDEALRDGAIDRLELVREEASRLGAVTARFQAEASIALQLILRGEFEQAETMLDQVIESTSRLRLLETVRYALLLRAILAAHRGRRREMAAAFTELRDQVGGTHAQHNPRAHGLARAWCALLEENRPLAEEELALALETEETSPTVYQLTGRYGLHLLLRAVAGTADWPQYEQITAAPASHLRWDRQFSHFAAAVLHGRAGRGRQAAESVEEALRAGSIYSTGRNLGLRLVAEAAIADGWGAPVDWLRSAEEYFHDGGVDPVAGACRSLLRRAGARVAQRRHGIGDVPQELRQVGVTVREYEVLCLLNQRLGNREIATRLHLSPRTVEKHVAALMAKTRQPNRIALSEFGL